MPPAHAGLHGAARRATSWPALLPRNPNGKIDRKLLSPATSVFDFDFYVLPQHRLGVGFLGVWHGANETLSAQGVRYTFSRLTRFNTASRRAHAHLGWKRVGSGVFLQAWGVEVMVSTLAPYLAFTFAPQQRVTLRLRPDVLRRGPQLPTASLESPQ
jgi:hypothetical protein